MKRVAGVIGVLLVIAGCHRGPGASTELEAGVRLRADSARYSVRADGPVYLATIRHQLENNSGGTLPKNYCHAPSPPSVEKQRANGGWMWAWDSVPGVYRLRWELRASADPDDRAAPMIAAVSPPFRLVLR